MSEIDPTVVALLEEIEIALIVTERLAESGRDVPLADVAARFGFTLDELDEDQA